MTRARVLTVFGTRPEAIKMAPVVKELAKYPDKIEQQVCVTAQHRQMLDQVLDLFQIKPDIDLALMEEQQTPTALTARAMPTLASVFECVKPSWVLVQGDTTTAVATALAAHYQRIPVGHLEAGLRTYQRYSPFPEEINRHLISVLATLHFAPTEKAASQLRAEGISGESIYLTGNTVIDALQWILERPRSPLEPSLSEQIGLPPSSVDGQRLILVTAHRRENFGQPLENICRALKSLVERNSQVEIVYPVHPNGEVREPVYRLLSNVQRIHLIDPLPYENFVYLMNQAHLILTDSGGIQEEAPLLGKPVLVLRRETERPEAVLAGTVRLVGTDIDKIVAETERLLGSDADYASMARAVSPYGDGRAAERIVKVLLSQIRD